MTLCPVCKDWAGPFIDRAADGHHVDCPERPGGPPGGLPAPRPAPAPACDVCRHWAVAHPAEWASIWEHGHHTTCPRHPHPPAWPALPDAPPAPAAALAAASAEVVRLRGMVEALAARVAAQSEALAGRAERPAGGDLGRLRAALVPFAELADRLDGWPDETRLAGYFARAYANYGDAAPIPGATLGDCRRARAALCGGPG